ncbi:MAG: peptidase M23 [Bacteroidetes bacterium]|nr:MAG: peptidase M23 [Bacteroidota bacterium]RLD75789.1 MAG: peptidase M23 [Bacteroidota bacterium]
MMLWQLNIRVFYQAFILSAISLFLLSAHVNGQDRKVNLQQEKKQIEAEIAYTNNLLDKTRKNRQSSMEGLAILQQKIRQRERLVNNIKAELVLIIQEIDETGDSIFTLTVELKKLKEEYAKMIYYANRHRGSYDRMVFIFSAEDFNQAYRRIKYFQQYSAYRRTQAVLITSTQDALSLKELKLERQKAEQQNLLSQEQEEKDQLEFEKGDVDRTIQDLGQKERKLKTDLRAKERAKAKLDKAIADIIAEEIRLAEERARAAAASTTTTSSGFALTPEEKILSENFSNNKGKLPWPTERGVVSSTYGEHQHPVLKRVKVKNNGIDILTSEGEYARAVFNGEVTRVISVPNYNNVVIVRHGEFLTVYSNLDEVLVSKGQKVTTKQRIGRVYTDRNENKTELHFEIWQAKELMNPAYWLAGK